MQQANVSDRRSAFGRRGVLLILLGLLILILLCAVLWIILRPRPPRLIANPGGPYTIGESQPLTFDGSGSTGENITTYTWDFGDGNTGTGVTPTYAYPDGPANFTVTLMVTDSRGQTNSATTQVTVNNLPPTAEANGPYTCFVGKTVQLLGVCDDPGLVDKNSLTCTWADFSGAVVSEPIYTCPATAGDVTITLTATDKDGASAQDSATVMVRVPGQPPVAKIKVYLRDKSGRIFGFDGGESFDPDGGAITSYQWDFGDGNTGDQVKVIHEYAAQGSYTVALTVTDTEGLTGTTSVKIP